MNSHAFLGKRRVAWKVDAPGRSVVGRVPYWGKRPMAVVIILMNLGLIKSMK